MHPVIEDQAMIEEENGSADPDIDGSEEMGFLWMCVACKNKPTFITVYDLFTHKKEQHISLKCSLTEDTTNSNDDNSAIDIQDDKFSVNDDNSAIDIQDDKFSINDEDTRSTVNSSKDDIPLSQLKMSVSKIDDKISEDLPPSANEVNEISDDANNTSSFLNSNMPRQVMDAIDDVAISENINREIVMLENVNDHQKSNDMEVEDGQSQDFSDFVNDNDCDDDSDDMNYNWKANNEDEKVKSKKPRNRYMCKICNEEFSSRRLLSKHKSVHICPEIGMFKCDTCGKVSYKYDNFTRHLAIHKENRKKSFSCETCSSSFYNMADLRRHVLQHLEVKPFKCEHCGESFIKQDTLLIHMTKHTGVQCLKFTCKQCGKIYNSPSSLAMHSKNHTKKTVFCSEPHCQFSCYLKSQLRQHMRRHSGEKPYQCSVCGRCFARGNDMKNHILNVHERVRPHQCPDCSKQFTLLSGLKTHRLTHLDVRPYLCAECGKRFSHPSTLRKHTIFLHNSICQGNVDGKVNDNRQKKKTRSRAETIESSQAVVKQEVTYADVAVQSLPIVTIPIHIPQIAVSLEQGYTQTFIIPSVTVSTTQTIKPEDT